MMEELTIEQALAITARNSKEEGKEEGLKEGRQEGQSLILKNMYSAGMSISDIINVSGLSEDVVRNLLK